MEEHCCDGRDLSVDKFLQIGSGIGRGLLAVGESPAGNGWRASGRAFYTTTGKLVPTGKNFLANLKQIDELLDLENISFTEIAKCFVANNRKALPSCAERTWPHFVSQLEYVGPKLIILLGKKTTEIFNHLAGSNLEIGELSHIEVHDRVYNILPIYHPSPLNPKRVKNAVFIDVNLHKIRALVG